MTGVIITFYSLMADECTLCHLNRPEKPKKRVVRQIYLLSEMLGNKGNHTTYLDLELNSERSRGKTGDGN